MHAHTHAPHTYTHANLSPSARPPYAMPQALARSRREKGLALARSRRERRTGSNLFAIFPFSRPQSPHSPFFSIPNSHIYPFVPIPSSHIHRFCSYLIATFTVFFPSLIPTRTVFSHPHFPLSPFSPISVNPVLHRYPKKEHATRPPTITTAPL